MRQTIARTAATALLALAAAWGNAQDWGNIAVISDTMGNNAGRLCVGEGLRVSDIGCPTYAPSVSTAGHVSITGNVSAQKFIGDGSLLTGLSTASGDRIVSGTNDATRMVAISDTGYISITQSGANSGWFSPYTGLVTLGVSATGGISGTTGYFNGPVGIGTLTPSSSLHVPGGAKFGNIFSSTGFNDHVVILSDAGTAFEGGLLLGNKDSADAANSSVKLAGSYSGTYADLKIGLVSNSAPNTFIKTFIYADGFTGNVGVNNNTPVAKLDVNGTISASDAIQVGQSNLLCNSPISGSIRYNITNDTLQVCTGGGWKSLVSGTASAGAAMAASSTGAVQFNVNNQLAGDTNNFFWDDTNNRLGIGTSDPSFSLMVNGGSGVGGGILSYGSVAPAITVSSSAAGIAGRGTVLMGLATSAGHYFPLSAVGDATVRSGYGHLYLGTASTTDVILAPSRTEVLRATNGGYVGIGTNTPSSTLHVMNNQDGATIVNLTNVTAGASARSIFLLNGSGAGKSGGLAYGNTSLNLGAGFESLRADALHLYSNGNASGGIALATSNASAPITFNAGGLATAGERMRISGAGLVGVGTQSATATLQVSGTFIVSSTLTNLSPSLYVSTAGYVGINTMAPEARLHIHTSDSVPALTLSRDGDNVNAITFASSQGFTGFSGGGSGGYMRVHIAGGVRMYFTPTGNVGMGTVVPAVSLTVVGEVQVSNSGVVCGSTTRGAIRYSGTSLQYCNATTWTTLGASGGGLEDRIVSGTTAVIANEDRSITFSTAGSQRMILDQNGSIGIGTNTPSTTFHIAHSNPRIILTDTDTGAQNWIDANSGGGALAFSADRNNIVANSFMGFSVDGSSVLTLRNGKAGISRTVPVADLDVIGTISASDAIQVGQSTLTCSGGISGSIRYSTTSDTLQVCTGSGWKSLVSSTVTGGTLIGTGSATAVAFWSGASDLTYSSNFYWDNVNSRVGIGKVTPTASIDIRASAGDSAIGVSTTTAKWHYVGTSNGVGFSGLYNDANSHGVLYLRDAVGNTGVFLHPSGTSYITGGSVGIGTANPMATLDVRGQGTTKLNFTDGDSTNSSLVLRDTLPNSQSGGQILFGSQQGLYAGIKGELRSGSGPAGNLNFQTRSTTGDILRRMVVFYDGRVGIGVSDTTNMIATTLMVSGSFAVSNSAQGTNPSFYISQGGSAGVGTFNPLASLDVRRSGNSNVPASLAAGTNALFAGALDMNASPNYVAINGGRTSYAGLHFGDVDNDAMGRILYDNNTNRMHFYVSNSVLAAYLDPAGKMGVNKATALANLDVLGTISASDAIQVGTSSLTCGAGIPGAIRYNSPNLQFCDGTTWTNIGGGGGGTVTGTGSATAVAYWNGPSGLTYDPDGFYWNATSNRLGIGTNVPGYVVHISASSPRFAISNGVGSTYAETLLLDEAGNAKWSMGAYGDSHSNTALRNGYYIYQYTNSSDAVLNQYRFFITDDGNVAVGGSISPTATLQVSGSFSVSSTQFSQSSSLYVGTNGRVGIGTSNPAQALTVEGVLDVRGTDVNSRFRGGMFGGPTAVTVNAYDDVGAVYHPMMVRVSNFQVRVGSAGLDPAFYINSVGSIGVSNTSPLAKLDVNGTISASNAIQVGQSTLVCGSPISGSIRFNTTSDTLQVCTGSGWKSLVSGTTGGADNLGNHIATQNIQTGPYWISRDGDNEGINISVDGNIGLGVAAVANYGFYNSTSTEATTSTRAGIFNTYVASPSTASAAAYYGDYNNVSYNSDQNLTGSVRGSYIGAVKAGSGAGTVTNMYGSMVYTLNTSSGTVTGMYGLYLNGTNTGGGAVTNYYGLYVPAFGGVAPTTNNYAIYTASAAQDIYLAGSTGIGRTAPVAKLDVLGSISASTIIDFGTQAWGNAADSVSVPSYSWTGDTNTGMYWVSADALGFTAGGAQRGRFTTAGLIVTGYVSTTGAIDIGTQAFGNAADSVSLPSYSWTGDPNTGMYSPAADQVAITTGGVQRILLNSSGVTGAAFLYSSDRRLKKDIVSLSGGLAKLDAINPVSFRFISDTTNREHLGVIAQDVEKVYPQAVVTDENGYKKVDYPALVPVLIGAVKELKAANDNLETAVDKLVSDNREMREEINVLKRSASGVR